MKKPLIGLFINYTSKEDVGELSQMGPLGQDWQLIASDYTKAVEKTGGCPVIIPIVDDIDTIWDFVKTLDGIIFTGGSDIDPKFYGQLPRKELGEVLPKRDIHEIKLAKRILEETKMPILGVCRGLQLINVITGGTLYQDLGTQWDGFAHSLYNYPKGYPSHEVTIDKNSRLYDIFEEESIWTNSFHHQAIDKLGEGLKATMKAKDGMIEGIEGETDRFLVAVQWHPEMMVDDNEKYLIYFKKFIDECK